MFWKMTLMVMMTTRLRLAGECEAQIYDGGEEYQEGAQVLAIFSFCLEKNASPPPPQLSIWFLVPSS
jgi:hypothetical protein